MKGFKWIPIDEIYEKYPELNKEDVKLVQKWIESQPHLPKITGESLCRVKNAQKN